MLINANMTVYEKDNFSRHNINDVYWNDSRGQTVSKNGVQVSDSVIVYLYSDEYVPKAGDVIIKGDIDFIFDVSSERNKSDSMKDFRLQYPEFAVVKSVNNCMFGGLPHIEIIAR